MWRLLSLGGGYKPQSSSAISWERLLVICQRMNPLYMWEGMRRNCIEKDNSLGKQMGASWLVKGNKSLEFKKGNNLMREEWLCVCNRLRESDSQWSIMLSMGRLLCCRLCNSNMSHTKTHDNFTLFFWNRSTWSHCCNLVGPMNVMLSFSHRPHRVSHRVCLFYHSV